MISIAGLEKALVLKTLYDRARPLGMGFLHAKQEPMSRSEAESLIGECKGRLYFDYVGGRPLKIDITGDELDPRLYDRDQGEGAAAMAISELTGSSAPRP